MNEILDFLTSPEFAEVGCWFLAGAATGGVIIGIIAGLISRWQWKREIRAAMRSRQPRFLQNL